MPRDRGRRPGGAGARRRRPLALRQRAAEPHEAPALAALHPAATLGAAELRRIAHALRGATEIFGGTQVAEACSVLEQAASGELTASRAQALVQVVERTCGEARAAMLAWLDAA